MKNLGDKFLFREKVKFMQSLTLYKFQTFM